MRETIFIIYLALVGLGAATQYLDWSSAKRIWERHDPKLRERNPVLRGLFGISPWLALAYKLVPTAALVVAILGPRDVQNYGVEYGDAPGVYDTSWPFVWLGLAAAVVVAGTYGFLKNVKADHEERI